MNVSVFDYCLLDVVGTFCISWLATPSTPTQTFSAVGTVNMELELGDERVRDEGYMEDMSKPRIIV